MGIDKVMADRIDQGVREAIAEAIERHRRLGESIAISENGAVKILSPDDILKRQRGEKPT